MDELTELQAAGIYDVTKDEGALAPPCDVCSYVTIVILVSVYCTFKCLGGCCLQGQLPFCEAESLQHVLAERHPLHSLIGTLTWFFLGFLFPFNLQETSCGLRMCM